MRSSSTSSSCSEAVPAPPTALDASFDLLEGFEASLAPLESLEALLLSSQPTIPLGVDSPASTSSSSRSDVNESASGPSSPSSDEPIEAFASSNSAVSTRKRRNSTRDRENAERAELRRQVEQLEALVMELKRRSGDSAAIQAKKRDITMWKRLAERQRLARRSAESANARMMKRAEVNAEWIRRLQGLVAKEQRETKRLLSSDWVRWSTWEDIMVFASLKQELWEAYSRVDQVLEMTGVAGILASRLEVTSVPTADEWTLVHPNAAGSTVVCARYLPFSSVAIVNALWEVLACIRTATHEAFLSGVDCFDENGSIWDAHANEASETDCSLKLQGRLIEGSDEDDTGVDNTVFANLRAVIKRFDNVDDRPGLDTRKVLVSRSLIQSGDNGARNSISTMWIVLTPCPGGNASILSIVSQLQGSDLGIGDPEATGRLTQSCIRGLLARVEGSLVDQGLRAVPPALSNSSAIEYASV